MTPIQWYYWLTPVFWLLDEFLGANLRAAALDGHPGWKAAYYVVCVAIGILGSLRSDWIPRLGLIEANVNIALLVAGILVPYYGFIFQAATGDIPTEAPITNEMVINFILASSIWVVALKARR